MGGPVYSLVRLVFNTLYPAYASFKAVKSKNVREYVKWMMYWITFSGFSALETVLDPFLLFWLPFYSEAKVVFLVYLVSPFTRGSGVIYRRFLHPALCDREEEIDAVLVRIKEQGYQTVAAWTQKSLSWVASIVLSTAIRGGGTVLQQIRRSYSMLDVADLAELAFKDQHRFQDVTEELHGGDDMSPPASSKLKRRQLQRYTPVRDNYPSYYLSNESISSGYCSDSFLPTNAETMDTGDYELWERRQKTPVMVPKNRSRRQKGYLSEEDDITHEHLPFGQPLSQMKRQGSGIMYRKAMSPDTVSSYYPSDTESEEEQPNFKRKSRQPDKIEKEQLAPQRSAAKGDLTREQLEEAARKLNLQILPDTQLSKDVPAETNLERPEDPKPRPNPPPRSAKQGQFVSTISTEASNGGHVESLEVDQTASLISSVVEPCEGPADLRLTSSDLVQPEDASEKSLQLLNVIEQDSEVSDVGEFYETVEEMEHEVNEDGNHSGQLEINETEAGDRPIQSEDDETSSLITVVKASVGPLRPDFPLHGLDKSDTGADIRYSDELENPFGTEDEELKAVEPYNPFAVVEDDAGSEEVKVTPPAAKFQSTKKSKAPPPPPPTVKLTESGPKDVIVGGHELDPPKDASPKDSDIVLADIDATKGYPGISSSFSMFSSLPTANVELHGDKSDGKESVVVYQSPGFTDANRMRQSAEERLRQRLSPLSDRSGADRRDDPPLPTAAVSCQAVIRETPLAFPNPSALLLPMEEPMEPKQSADSRPVSPLGGRPSPTKIFTVSREGITKLRTYEAANEAEEERSKADASSGGSRCPHCTIHSWLPHSPNCPKIKKK